MSHKVQRLLSLCHCGVHNGKIVIVGPIPSRSAARIQEIPLCAPKYSSG